MFSNTDLYVEGTFDPVVERVLREVDTAREVLAEYQAKAGDDYVPFNPI
jgi:lysyl-tRNA synthetase (EC 6.1.1.6)